MKQVSVYGLKEIETVNEAFSQLPKGELYDVWAQKGNNVDNAIPALKRKAVVVNGQVVSVMSDHYKLVQHSEAFHPIREGLAMRNTNFQYSLWSTPSLAKFAVYVGEGEDGVKFGFRCINSFDGSRAINYGFQSYRRIESLRVIEKEHVLMWGYRQTCENGMVIRVPLKTCKYLDAVKVTKIKTLLSENSRILHRGDVAAKLETVQYVVEAFLLLKDPMNMMIIDAQKHNLTGEEALDLIKKYVGRRKADKYLEQYGFEEKTLWGLYNSLTWLASHAPEMTESKREGLLNKAANLLEGELLAEAQ